MPESVMSLLVESCAVRAEQQGDTDRAQAYRVRAEGYRRVPRSPRTSQRRAQPRREGPQTTPSTRYMTQAQCSYLGDLVGQRPPAEAEAIIEVLNAEWCARTLTVGRASAWISHLLSHPGSLILTAAPAESHPNASHPNTTSPPRSLDTPEF